MTEKVKITQGQADAIESHINNMGADGILNEALALKYKTYTGNSVTTPELYLLSRMKITQLSHALYGGYEVEPEYKVGDWVVKENERVIIGQIYLNVVETFDVDRAEKQGMSFNSSQWGHATPEEIKDEKERRFWTKIEREAGELKIDDVYRLKQYPHINIYIRNEATLADAKENYMNGDILGFYPAESFISFEAE